MGFTRRPAFTSGPVRSKAPVLSRFVAANAPLVVTALLVAGVLCLGWRPLVHSSGAPVDSSTLQRQHAGAGSAGAAGKQWGGGRRSAAETATDAAAQQAATHAAVAEAAVAAQVSADPAAAMQAAVAAVNASSEVHGFVSKQGPADPRNWHPNYKAYREARLAAWLKEREQLLAEGEWKSGRPAAGSGCARRVLHRWRRHVPPRRARPAAVLDRANARPAGRLPPPMPVYMGCQVYVNHLYKVIYLRHAKTASSSLFCHFGGCRDNATDSDAARLRFEPLQVGWGGGRAQAEAGGAAGAASPPTCGVQACRSVQPPPNRSRSQVNSTQAMEALWRDYLVVTFVRNPYQRAVSSYRMMMRQLAAGGPVAPAYSWGAFCADPTGFADQCMRDEFCSK